MRQSWKRYALSPYILRILLFFIIVTSRIHRRSSNTTQGIVKGFTESGFKTQVQPLSAFKENYGLEADDDEDANDDDEEGDDEDGSEEGENTEQSDDE